MAISIKCLHVQQRFYRRARSCSSAHGNQKARLEVLVPPDGWRSAWTAREDGARAISRLLAAGTDIKMLTRCGSAPTPTLWSQLHGRQHMWPPVYLSYPHLLQLRYPSHWPHRLGRQSLTINSTGTCSCLPNVGTCSWRKHHLVSGPEQLPQQSRPMSSTYHCHQNVIPAVVAFARDSAS